MPHKQDTVAVLIPTYENYKRVEELIEGVRETIPYAFIFLYVPDGVCLSNYLIDQFDVKFVKGKSGSRAVAVSTLLRRVTADYYVIADEGYSPKYIPDLLLPVVTGNADMVLGVAAVDCNVSYANATKRLNKKYSTSFSDLLTPFRAFNMQAAQEILCTIKGDSSVELQASKGALESGCQIMEVIVDSVGGTVKKLPLLENILGI